MRTALQQGLLTICEPGEERNYMKQLKGHTSHSLLGGTSGIGSSRRQKRLFATAASTFITGRRRRSWLRRTDIGHYNVRAYKETLSIWQLDRLFANHGGKKGQIDIVFANAGSRSLPLFGTITEELYDWTFDITVKVCSSRCKRAAVCFLPNGASIIMNSSVVGSKGLPLNSVYSHQSRPVVLRRDVTPT